MDKVQAAVIIVVTRLSSAVIPTDTTYHTGMIIAIDTKTIAKIIWMFCRGSILETLQFLY